MIKPIRNTVLPKWIGSELLLLNTATREHLFRIARWSLNVMSSPIKIWSTLGKKGKKWTGNSTGTRSQESLTRNTVTSFWYEIILILSLTFYLPLPSKPASRSESSTTWPPVYSKQSLFAEKLHSLKAKRSSRGPCLSAGRDHPLIFLIRWIVAQLFQPSNQPL